MAKINICIVDDHPLYRKGLKDIINLEEDFHVVSECGDGAQVPAMIAQHQPTALILDLNLPGKHGLDIVKDLHETGGKVKIIILTMEKDEETFNKAMDLGVSGYILKESAPHEIIESIRAVLSEHIYISPVVASYLMNRRHRNTALRKSTPALDTLTAMESKILKYISENKSSREIAEILFNSERTIENHRTRICKKLGLHGTFALLKFAIENKTNLK